MLKPDIIGLGRIFADVIQLAFRTARSRLHLRRRAEPAGAQPQFQFPLTLADREHSERGVMHDRLADWLSLFSKKGRKQVIAVFGGIIRKRDAGDLGGCSHKISQTPKLITYRAGLDLAGPTGDERNAMARVPDVGLLTAP